MRRFFIIGLMLSVSPAAWATTFSINPSADAMVVSGSTKANNNYGGAGAIAMYGSSTNATNGQIDSVMKFDLSGVKAFYDGLFGAGAWTVNSVSLQLNAAAGMNNGVLQTTNVAGPFRVDYMFDANSGWTEGTGTPMSPGGTGITYTSMNSTYLNGTEPSLGSFNYNGVLGASSYSLSLGSGLINDINSGSVASMHLVPTNSTITYTFNAKDFTTASARPVLTIDAIPEPASLGLAGLAVLALGRRRRH